MPGYKTVNISVDAVQLLDVILAHYRQKYSVGLSQAKAVEAALRSYCIQLDVPKRDRDRRQGQVLQDGRKGIETGRETMVRTVVDDHKIYVLPRHHLTLPLRTSPVNFSVKIKNGPAAHPWGVTTNKKGDVYIYARDTLQGAKISLHDSGRQHMVLTPTSGSIKTWQEPPRNSPLTPSVKLLFTRWAATVGAGTNLSTDGKWKDNHILLEGEDDGDLAVSVWFFITDADTTLQLPPEPPMGTIAILPVGLGKELHMIVTRQYRPNAKEDFDTWLKTTIKVDCESPPTAVGKEFVLLVAGEDPSGCPYLMPLSVMLKTRIVKEAMGSHVYDMCMESLVNTGLHSDPELWGQLPVEIRAAWETIGSEWFRQLPQDTELGQVIAKGAVELEE